MEELILFFMTFLFVLCLYEFFIVRKAIRKSKKKKEYEPIEVTYLTRKYHLDLKKISYNQLLQIIALTSSFDIALVVSVLLLIKNFILEIIVGILLSLVIIVLSYHFVYLFYKKKGMIKHES